MNTPLDIFIDGNWSDLILWHREARRVAKMHGFALFDLEAADEEGEDDGRS